MTAEATPILFTTQAEVESVFSQLGVQTRIEDSLGISTPMEQQAIMDAVIREVTDEITMTLGHCYSPESLETSLVVRRWASVLCCHYLSRRRGNASQFDGEAADVLKKMEDVKCRRTFIPRIKPIGNLLPSVIAPVYDDRFHDGKLRYPTTLSKNPAGADIADDRLRLLEQ